MTVVLDASVLVAILIDRPAERAWAVQHGARGPLALPAHAPVDCGNVLRGLERRGEIDATTATLAHGDAIRVPADYYAYSAVAERTWELRENLTAYDAAYVALAELLDTTLLTLDRRLAKAPGPRCRIVTPDL